VTIVMVIQMLIAVLAGLLLLEARLHRDERDSRVRADGGYEQPVEFHRELL